MRKPITQASFHDDVRGWSFEDFAARFADQLTTEEIEYFAKVLGIVKKPKPAKEKETKTTE